MLRGDREEEDVAARTRRDLLLMGFGDDAGGLLGVAADAKSDGRILPPQTHFTPESISDADFTTAVRRGLDDLRQLDEVRDPRL